jgi:hypothetical protein
LDGLDEVDFDHRLTVERQLMNLIDSYPKTGIIISSRPDEHIASWEKFTLYHVQPMKKSQIKELIGRLRYDPAIKSRFTKELDDHLYDKHTSFLSNPLLATMMLMTFDQFANIPDKIHIFYEQAFETLFFRHDAAKQAAFRRRMYTALPINDFKNCLSALCISTYAKEKFSFSEATMLDGIRMALRFEKISCDERDFFNDLLESLCILQRDGLFLSFTHRSFQEYFAAFFISRSPSISLAPLLDRLCLRVEDNVINMAFDMNRTLIERDWISPKLSELVPKLESLDPKNNLIEISQLIYGEVQLRVEGSRSALEYTIVRASPWTPFVSTLLKLYPGHFSSLNGIFSTRIKEDQLVISDELMRREEDRMATRTVGSKKTEVQDGQLRFGEIVLVPSDGGWVKRTSFGELLERECQALQELKSIVEASISQKEAMVGELFQ